MGFADNPYHAQTQIMDWLRQKGHKVDYGRRETARERFIMRSCTMKKRYSIEPPLLLNERAYSCEFCQGWHKTVKK